MAKPFVPMFKQNFRTIGVLSKAFYEKYGEEALPIISKVMSMAGAEGAEMAKHKLKGKGMKDVGEIFKMFEILLDVPLEMVELSDETIHYKHPPPCMNGLEGTSKELCEALCPARGAAMVSTVLEEEVGVEVVKCVAAGDEYCEVIYSKK